MNEGMNGATDEAWYFSGYTHRALGGRQPKDWWSDWYVWRCTWSWSRYVNVVSHGLPDCSCLSSVMLNSDNSSHLQHWMSHGYVWNEALLDWFCQVELCPRRSAYSISYLHSSWRGSSSSVCWITLTRRISEPWVSCTLVTRCRPPTSGDGSSTTFAMRRYVRAVSQVLLICYRYLLLRSAAKLYPNSHPAQSCSA